MFAIVSYKNVHAFSARSPEIIIYFNSLSLVIFSLDSL